jgi:glucosamine--fructose-6-phosphate aminotransferase (isomerizing)
MFIFGTHPRFLSLFSNRKAEQVKLPDRLQLICVFMVYLNYTRTRKTAVNLYWNNISLNKVTPEMPEQTQLFNEIQQQPDVLTRLLTTQTEVITQLATEIQRRKINYVMIAARGTSDNAGRYAQYLMGAVNKLVVALATPSLYSVYRQPPEIGNALVIGISQSGKSPDIVAVLAEARRQGALTASITNVPNSDLSREAEYNIMQQAGKEHAIAATKTYTSQLAAIALLSATLAESSDMFRELSHIPLAVANALTLDVRISEVVQRYRYMRDCVVIGRGYNYATAFEVALKMKELAYIVAEPYSSADFLHGPLALVERGFPAFVMAPSGVLLPEIKQFIHTLNERGAEVVVVSDDDETLDLARIPLRLPQAVPEWLSPITAIVPGQLLALYLAHVKDYDPDHPRGLRKVTETR